MVYGAVTAPQSFSVSQVPVTPRACAQGIHLEQGKHSFPSLEGAVGAEGRFTGPLGTP